MLSVRHKGDSKCQTMWAVREFGLECAAETLTRQTVTATQQLTLLVLAVALAWLF